MLKQIIISICKYTLLLNEMPFSESQIQSQWLGYAPASDMAIVAAEKRLGQTLPSDYTEFLKITNGFPTLSVTNSALQPIEKIDYLVNIDEELIEIWEEGNPEFGKALRSSIIIGGVGEEQYVLLLPPSQTKKSWTCWLFASWIPGEHEYVDFTAYLQNVEKKQEEQAKGLKTPKPTVDYSLREAVFSKEWKQVYEKSTQFIETPPEVFYFNGVNELYLLILLASNRLENQTVFISFLKEKQKTADEQRLSSTFFDGLIEAASQKMPYLPAMANINYFQNLPNAKGLIEVEKIIIENRKDLLKEKNLAEKISYQLYSLYSFGNATEFISLYESNSDKSFFREHLQAAVIFGILGNSSKSKVAIEKYQTIAKDFRPFEPYLQWPQLLPILLED